VLAPMRRRPIRGEGTACGLNSSTDVGRIRAGRSTLERRAGSRSLRADEAGRRLAEDRDPEDRSEAGSSAFPGSPPDRARRRACRRREQRERGGKIAHRFCDAACSAWILLPAYESGRPPDSFRWCQIFRGRRCFFHAFDPACYSMRRARPRLPGRIDGHEPRKAGPFVKGAGGKTSLLPELHKHVPGAARLSRAVVGGGALSSSLRPRRAFLAIQTRADPRLPPGPGPRLPVLDALSLHVYERGHFEAVRALDPLRLPAAERARASSTSTDLLQRPLAVFNRAGRFNVPSGATRPPPSRSGALIRASQALQERRSSTPLRAFPREARAGDFVYLIRPTIRFRHRELHLLHARTPSAGPTRSASPAACAALNRRASAFPALQLRHRADPAPLSRLRAAHRGTRPAT